MRNILRDERGFFLVSALKKAGKVVVGAVKTGVKIGAQAIGISQPQPQPVYIPAATPSAGPPASSTTSPQPYASPLEKIAEDLREQIAKVVRAPAEEATKAALASDAAQQQRRTLYIAGGVLAGLVVLTLVAVVVTRD